MLTALILIVLLAGIVYASRRWPDIEARVFGVDKVDVAKEQTAEPVATGSESEAASTVDKTTAAVKGHAQNAGRVAERTISKVTEVAGGLFKKKEISEEPEVNDDASVTTKEDFSTKAVADDAADTADSDEAAAGPAASIEESITPRPPRAPGERVTSVPARPSQPAYLDGTRNDTSDNFEQLSAEADQAWRDREYERCEEACLKILVQQPKNIKYMTRIGQVYQQLGQLDDAKEAFEAAKKLDPRNFFVLNRLTEVERLLSDKKGRTQLNKVLKK